MRKGGDVTPITGNFLTDRFVITLGVIAVLAVARVIRRRVAKKETAK